ncbi:MAG: PilZ domain-containing protein [Myxococcota bacterium]|nr:PilZ domain-containing protein [Myxococcota bacterium]
MNRRRQYRVTAEFEKYVKLELLGPKVHATRVRLLDLSSGGCAVELPRTADGLLACRDLVDLRVTSERLPAALDMSGQVAWIKGSPRAPLVGLNFINWRQHRMLLDSDLKGLFNEREAFRVAPDSRRPISIELHIGDDQQSTIKGAVRDISVLGIGVSVGASELPHDTELDTATARFVLPDSTQSIDAPVEVRYVRSEPEQRRAHVGLRLAAPDRLPMTARRSLQRYVMGRQRALCRMGVREVA